MSEVGWGEEGAREEFKVEVEVEKKKEKKKKLGLEKKSLFDNRLFFDSRKSSSLLPFFAHRFDSKKRARHGHL